jgi:hypothetical protein
MPADSRPRTYAEPIVPTRYGSSPMVSSIRPQRRSLATSSTGASPWWTPRPRISRPIRSPILATSAGSKLAPQHSGDGYTVACQAASPVRHSSCTIAGIPNRPAVMICCCVRATLRAPISGSTGTVPNALVSWPMPSLISSSKPTASAVNSCWCGATSPAASMPTHTP